jgi:ATP-dependent Clp protease protease subunit
MGAGYSMKAKSKGAAEIYVYEDVGESWFGGVTAKQFAADLKALGAVETIDVRINSGGGDVFDGLAIYRQLVEHQARVVAHVDGLAASIASVIAMAGDEIRISESGFMMIHDAWGIEIGDAAAMRKMADMLETTSSAITDVYAARTRAERTQLRTWMEAETWFTGAEAVDAGLADVMDENLRVAAHLDLSKHKFRHAPAALVPGVVRPSLAPAPSNAPPTPNMEAASRRLSKLKARLSLAS